MNYIFNVLCAQSITYFLCPGGGTDGPLPVVLPGTLLCRSFLTPGEPGLGVSLGIGLSGVCLLVPFPLLLNNLICYSSQNIFLYFTTNFKKIRYKYRTNTKRALYFLHDSFKKIYWGYESFTGGVMSSTSLLSSVYIIAD